MSRLGNKHGQFQLQPATELIFIKLIIRLVYIITHVNNLYQPRNDRHSRQPQNNYPFRHYRGLNIVVYGELEGHDSQG